jgi:hypothetical protein
MIDDADDKIQRLDDIGAKSCSMTTARVYGMARPVTSILARRVARPSSQPLQGGQTADLDRRVRRARVNASAPRGMQPASHHGEGVDGDVTPPNSLQLQNDRAF